MIGQLLCRLGLHRWEWAEVRDLDELVAFFRCRRPFCQHRHWVVGNADPIRR